MFEAVRRIARRLDIENLPDFPKRLDQRLYLWRIHVLQGQAYQVAIGSMDQMLVAFPIATNRADSIQGLEDILRASGGIDSLQEELEIVEQQSRERGKKNSNRRDTYQHKAVRCSWKIVECEPADGFNQFSIEVTVTPSVEAAVAHPKDQNKFPLAV